MGGLLLWGLNGDSQYCSVDIMGYVEYTAALSLLCLPFRHAAGFAPTVNLRVLSKSITSHERGSTGVVQAEVATSAMGLGGVIGDKIATAVVESPLYPFLIRKARGTMKKSAEV